MAKAARRDKGTAEEFRGAAQASGPAKKAEEAVTKETITDDRGQEIAFKKPDGNKLARIRPFFPDGMSVTLSPPTRQRPTVRKRQEEPPAGTSAAIAIAAS